ncbi:hypothetical protein [Georgenia wangjunii]|uniref:hypothetical protein n=1 Tax=Georgenia wangjunii TaxID=3117730 RepID=UPI002F26C86F
MIATIAQRTRRRAARLAAAGTTAVVLLAGCAGEVPQPVPDPSATTPVPVLDEVRIDRVLAEVEATLAAADEGLDPEALAERLSGPALEMRQAEYRLAQASGGENPPTPLTTESQIEVVATTDEWPRTLLVVSHPPEGSNLPLLLALTQEDPRSQYSLWFWTRLLPGTQTPPTASSDIGSTPVALDADGLVASPQETLAAYAAALNDAASESAALFAADAYRETYAESQAALAASVEAAGEVSRVNEVVPEATAALSTTDGGAIVVGVIRSTLTMRKTVEGSTLHAGGAIATLMGEDTEVEGAVNGHYDVTLAFHVPPAGSDDPITVLGADQVLVEVTQEDPPPAEPAE